MAPPAPGAGLKNSSRLLGRPSLVLPDRDVDRLAGDVLLDDECLHVHGFTGLDDARRKIEDWRRDYNETRPHSSLGDLAPAAYVAELLGLSQAAQL